jgi:hypothetical protein
MKKLLVLSALLGLLVLPVFADHTTLDNGGDMTFGFVGDFGDNIAEELDLTWDVIVGIDDYNSFTWSLAGLYDAPNLSLDKALVTTDVGMWLGLPVGLKVMWGYDDPDANEFGDVTGYGNQTYDFSPDVYWGMDFMLSYSIIEVELAFNPSAAVVLVNGAPPAVADNGDLLAGLAVKEPIPGLNAEVYYFQGGSTVGAAYDEFDLGSLGIGAAYAMDVSDIALEAGVSFEYALDDTVTSFGAWQWTLGLVAGYSMFEASLGIGGYDGETVSGMDFTVDVDAVDMASLYAGAVMSFIDGTDTFQGADIGVNAHIGAVECYLGYLITENGAGDYNAPNADLTDGGAYIKFDVDY